MDIMEMLNELENELTARGGFFGKKIDVDRCASLVANIRAALPKELGEARYIMENRKKILENADIAAKNTIREAEEHAEHIIDNSEIIKRAELDAKQIMETACMQCDTLVHHTKEHLDNTFKETEQFLLSTLTMIRNNREELRGAMISNTDKR